MNSQGFKKHLSLPVISAVTIIIAIAVKIIFQYYYITVDTDKSYQILAAKNFLNGHGFSLLEVYANDLSSSKFVPLIKWPPGYSFFLSPFLAIFKNDVFLAIIMLDAITCIFFILYARKLLFASLLPIWLVNIYTLVVGFFFYSFCTASSSDFITLTILIIALYYVLKIIQSNRIELWKIILISILLFTTAFIRYMYIPVALAVPACIIIYSIFNKNKLLLKKGLSILVFVFTLIVAFLILQYSYAESALYIRKADNGFYFSNLKKFHPVILSSIISLDFVAIQLSIISGKSFETFNKILAAFHFIVLTCSVIVFSNWMFQKKLKFFKLSDIYLFTGTIISFVIIFILTTLSIRNSLYLEYGYGGWTYVQESRYFAFVTFFTQQVLFILAYQFRYTLKKWLKLFLLLSLSLILLETVHNIYFSTKLISKEKKHFRWNKKSIALFAYTDSIIKKVTNDNLNKKIIVIPQFAHHGAQSGFYQNIPALYMFSSMRDIKISTVSSVKVIMIAADQEYMPISLVNSNSKQIIGTFNEYNFYTIDVKPN